MEEKKIAKIKRGNGHDIEEAKRLKEEEERYKAIAFGEGLPPTFKALFGKDGEELSEVCVLTDREKVFFAVQTMQEQLTNPKRTKRASQVMREAYQHNSIAVAGQGRKDIHLLSQVAMEQQAAQRGQAFA